MSDSALRYVPIDPSFCPEPVAVAAAEAALKSMLPAAESIAAQLSEHVRFVDAGGNWEGVRCPACGEDAESWWSDAMSTAAESDFRSLLVTAHCCGTSVSLDKMKYGWPVAFGRFVLEAFNPNSRGLSEAELERISILIGCDLLEVKAYL